MRKPHRNHSGTVIAIVVFFLSTFTPVEAATRYTTSEYAVVGTQCRITGEYSLAATGALVCSKNSWTLVAASKDSVSTRAYRSLLTRYIKMPDSTPNLLLRLEPSAGNWKYKVQDGLNAGARLWGTSTPEDAPIPAYISETGAFISKSLAKDNLKENPDDAKRNKEAEARGGGQAGFHGPYFDFVFSDRGSHDTGFYQVGPHEYTHYAQMIFADHHASEIPREFWLDEGCASYVGTSMGGILKLPQNQRARVLEYMARVKNPATLSFYSQGGPELYSNPKFNDVFDIGAIACEALVALNGIDSIEKYYRALAPKESTAEAIFPSIFGTSLKSYIGVLQKYVTSSKTKKVMTLAQLQTEYEKVKIPTT